MTSEQQLIEALQITVKAQADLIELLKIELQRRNDAHFVEKMTTPILPGSPYQPLPLGPGLLPYQQPYNPFAPIYVSSNIKCVTTTPLPPVDLEG